MLKKLFFYFAVIIIGSALLIVIDKKNEVDVRGAFQVVDGDTLRLGSERLRLIGFDAPELKQRCGQDSDSWPCGEASKRMLQDIVERSDFHCEGSQRDKYNRLLVFCFANSQDVGEIMVASGMAVATQKFLYQGQQRTAKQEGVGLWSGPFERPIDWRMANRRAEFDLPSLSLLMVVRRAIGW